MVSHNPNDAKHGYCGACHRWSDDDGIVCWFCHVCKTMTLLVRAERGECAVEPRPDNCPTLAMIGTTP
jgi:hypothetical protein